MNEKLHIMGTEIDCLNVAKTMEQVQEFLKNGRLDLIQIVTVDLLLAAEKDSRLIQRLSEAELCLPGEEMILNTVREEAGELLEELENHDFYNRLFWYLIRKDQSFFLAGQDQEELDALEGWLREEYTEIRIVGTISEDTPEESSEDARLNQINSNFPDVIISGLHTDAMEDFLLRNRRKLSAGIWLSLGGDPYLQKMTGIARGKLKKFFRDASFRRALTKETEEKL